MGGGLGRGMATILGGHSGASSEWTKECRRHARRTKSRIYGGERGGGWAGVAGAAMASCCEGSYGWREGGLNWRC
jgi:hypothetical protein